MPAVLDTHAAIWYLLDSAKLSQPIYSLIDGASASGTPTYLSAVSLVEVVYLVVDRFNRSNHSSESAKFIAANTATTAVSVLKINLPSDAS
jgi:PIN domain nuclease of toxin-antitoxin system